MSEQLEMIRTADVIAAEINAIKDQVKGVVLSASIKIGEKLIEARKMVPHGSWGKWLSAHVDYSERTAQNLMSLHETYGARGELPDIGYTNAVILLGAPAELRDALIESGDAADMSTRELQAALAAEREKSASLQLRFDEISESRKESDALREVAIEEIGELRGMLESAQEANRARAAELEEQKKQAAKAGEGGWKAADKADKARIKAEKELEASRKSMDDLKAKLADAEARASKPEIVQQEVVPPEVTAELEQLREVARKAPSREVILVRDGYERLTKQFGEMEGLIAALEQGQPEEAGRYRAAIAKACRTMADKIGGAA